MSKPDKTKSKRVGFKVMASTLVESHGRILLVQHGKDKSQDRWGLPGGRVVAGESVVDAAVRETRRDSGCPIVVRELLGFYESVNRKGEPCLHFAFLAELKDKKTKATDATNDETRWFNWRELAALEDGQLRRPRLIRRVLADALRFATPDLSATGGAAREAA